VATLVAVLWVDGFGRKPLLLLGSAGMCIGLLIVAGAFFELQKVTSSEHAAHGPASAGILALVGLVIFIASFAFSLGPVVWTVINEVFRPASGGEVWPWLLPSIGSPPGWWRRRSSRW
jgi:MFS family permease